MKNIMMVLFILLSISTLQAKEYKALFDCSSGDAHYLNTRMFLIGKTASMMKEDGDTTDFVLTLHGDCAPLISKNFEEIVDDSDVENMLNAQQALINLAKNNTLKVVTCAMSLKRNGIPHKDVLDFVHISKNSYIDAIKYQNDGYAIMTFK